MTTTPRVLQVITGLGTGGAEQQLRLLLRHLPYDCDVVTLTNPGPVADGLRADGVRVTDLGMRGNRDPAALPRLAGLIRGGGYGLVHTHLYRACVYGRIAARLAGVRAVVATEHSLGEHEIEGRPLTRGTRALYLATERLGAATVAVSDTVAARLGEWGVPPRRTHTVPNGIDAHHFRFDPAARAAVRAALGIAPDAFVLGGVGRLVPGKGFDSLIRAAADVPAVTVLLAGEGPERPALEHLAATLGVAARVHFLGDCAAASGAAAVAEALTDGPRFTVAAVLSGADAFVSASREEAFGLAVIEALAAGLPVVYRTCPAVEDLGPGAVTGALRFAGDDASLTAAVRELVARGARPERAPLGGAERYDIRRTAGLVAEVYERVLADTGTGRDRPYRARREVLRAPLPRASRSGPPPRSEPVPAPSPRGESVPAPAPGASPRSEPVPAPSPRRAPLPPPAPSPRGESALSSPFPPSPPSPSSPPDPTERAHR